MHRPEADSFEESSISEKVPYHLVGDEAFALQSWLLCPYLIQGIPERGRQYSITVYQGHVELHKTPFGFYQ